MKPFAAHGRSWAATVFVLASGRGHRVFENAEVGDLLAATLDLSRAFPTAGPVARVHSIARRQFCGRRRSVYAGGQMHPRVNALSSVAWQYRSAIRSWPPTACGQTLHVASSTRYAVPRSLPSLSLVWGVT